MDDETAADDAARARLHADHRYLDINSGAAGAVRPERRKIACVMLSARIVAVRFAERIEVSFRANTVPGAAVARFVDVKPVLRAGLETLDVHDNAHLVAYLREGRLPRSIAALCRLQVGARARAVLGHCLTGA